MKHTGKVASLTGEEVDMDVAGVRGTWIVDSLFLVYTPMDPESFISVFSLNSNAVLYKNLILQGRGPNEYSEVTLIQAYTGSSGVKAWFSVNYRDKLICVDITASIEQQRLVVEREMALNVEDKFAVFRVFYDTDTSVVLQSLFNNDRISAYNPESGTMRSFGWLYSQDYDQQNISDLSTGYVYNAQKSILAGGMLFFNQMNFFPLKGEKPFSISTARSAVRYDDLKEVPEHDRRRYYGSICYDEEMLILTYASGKNREEEFSAEQNFLQVVSWEGELLKIFELDCYLIEHSYDKKTGYLYGIDIATDRLLRYKLDL